MILSFLRPMCRSFLGHVVERSSAEYSSISFCKGPALLGIDVVRVDTARTIALR